MQSLETFGFWPVQQLLKRYRTNGWVNEEEGNRGMVERFGLSILVFAIWFSMVPLTAFGQSQVDPGHSQREIRWGALVGIGTNPAPRGVLGVHLLTPVLGPVLGMLDYSFVSSAFVSCNDSWPESYECAFKGHSVLLGAEVELGRDSWTQPFLDLGLGAFFRRGGSSENRRSFTSAAGAGVRFSPGGTFSWKILARHSWMFDDGYADLMGEDLRFSFVALELEVHPRR